jgi:hypothetical protein
VVFFFFETKGSRWWWRPRTVLSFCARQQGM